MADKKTESSRPNTLSIKTSDKTKRKLASLAEATGVSQTTLVAILVMEPRALETLDRVIMRRGRAALKEI